MKSLLVRVSSLVAAGSSLLFVSAASAQPESECASDADCEHGYECQASAVSGCVGPAAPPCDPDGDCVAPEPVECETQEWTSCVPASGCSEDSDCADGMVCVSSQSGTCSVEACSPEGECPEPVCETETYSQCTQPWNAPCEAAADCGEGFDCVYYEECSCSGGGVDPVSPAPDPGSDDPASDANAAEAAPANPATPVAPLPVDPTCDCGPSETGSCQVQEIECEADSDCPADWTCQAQYTGGSGGGTSEQATAGEPDIAVEGDQRMPPEEDLIAPAEPLPPADDPGDEDPKEPPTSVDGGANPPPPDAPSKSVCLPPGYYGSPPTSGETPASDGDTGGDSGEGPREETDPATPPAPEPDLADAGAPLPGEPTDEQPSSDEDPVAPDTDAPERDEPAGSEGDEDNEGDEPAEEDEEEPQIEPIAVDDDDSSDGCAVAQTSSSHSQYGLGLLGLAGLMLARRRRS